MDNYKKLMNDSSVLRGFKYSVPSKGILGKNQIWRIYLRIDRGPEETLYVEHLEFKGVAGFSGEGLHGIGYAFFSRGQVTVTTDEKGLKTAHITP